ncbi:MAG: hypothetical protein ACREC4_03705 [Methylocella sp.]
MPPLIVAMSGGQPRPRKFRAPTPDESKLQIDTAELLRAHCLPDWRWTHFPAGEARDKIAVTRADGSKRFFSPAGVRLKRFGLHPGWPDNQLLNPFGQYHGLELKRLGEDLTPAQREFKAWADARGVPYEVAWTIDQVLGAFDRWGCLRVRSNGASRAHLRSPAG